MPGGIYYQCMFLLRKRCYIQYHNLQQMMSFNTNKNGNIEIDEEDWDAFLQSPDWRQEVRRFQNIIFQKSTETKKLFTKSKDELSDAYQNLSDFDQRFRGNAYDEQMFQENELLILAFNDTLIKMFGFLTEKILNLKKRQQETGINIHLVYDLISAIVFRQFFKSEDFLIKLSQYDEEKRKCECEELLYRIEIAYNEWIVKKNYPDN